MVYFFFEEKESHPKMVLSMQNFDFEYNIAKEGIKSRPLDRQSFEREKLVIEGQYIRLFFGYFLNWTLRSNINIEIHSSYLFEYSFLFQPIITQYEEHRVEYGHLKYSS